MNKKLLLLFTFFISFMVSIDIAQAAAKMTCTYDYDPRRKPSNSFDKIVIKQDEKGNLTITKGNQKLKKNSLTYSTDYLKNWALNDDGTFKKCPPCAKVTEDNKILLSGVGKDKMCFEGPKSNPGLAGRETSNTNWTNTCKYVSDRYGKNSTITIQFNKSNFIMTSSNFKIGGVVPYPNFTLMQLLSKAEGKNGELECPDKIYATTGNVLNTTKMGRVMLSDVKSDTFNQEEAFALINDTETTDYYRVCNYPRSDRTDAAQGFQEDLRIVQDSKGNRKYYYGSGQTEKDITSEIKIEDFSALENAGDFKDNKILKCPECIDKNGKKVTGAYDKGEDRNYLCKRSYVGLDRTTSKDVDYKEEQKEEEKKNKNDCSSGQWIGICTYKMDSNQSVKMFYSATKVKIEDSKVKFNAAKLYSVNGGKCPAQITYEYSGDYSFDNPFVNPNTGQQLGKIIELIDEYYCEESPGKQYTDKEPEKCSDLINEDIQKLINNAMKFIRIIVPVLLLIFGTTDFFTAVFSSDEETMISKRKKFFKRLLAAVIVFIVPVFVNLVLKLANLVWSNINEDTCISETSE